MQNIEMWILTQTSQSAPDRHLHVKQGASVCLSVCLSGDMKWELKRYRYREWYKFFYCNCYKTSMSLRSEVQAHVCLPVRGAPWWVLLHHSVTLLQWRANGEWYKCWFLTITVIASSHDKTVSSCPHQRCEHKCRQDETVLSYLDPVSNLQLFSLKIRITENWEIGNWVETRQNCRVLSVSAVWTSYYKTSTVTSVVLVCLKCKCTFVCCYMAPPGECYYNTLLCCNCFSSSSVLSHTFSVLCVYSTFGHHPHPVGYLCAKFRFFYGLHCWASTWRKIVYSVTQSPSLFDAQEPKCSVLPHSVNLICTMLDRLTSLPQSVILICTWDSSTRKMSRFLRSLPAFVVIGRTSSMLFTMPITSVNTAHHLLLHLPQLISLLSQQQHNWRLQSNNEVCRHTWFMQKRSWLALDSANAFTVQIWRVYEQN